MTTTTQSGVADAAPSFEAFDEGDAANEFLSRWSDEDPSLKASEDPEDEDLADEEDEPVEQEEAESEPEEDEEETEDPQDEAEESEEDAEEGEDVEETKPKKGKELEDDAIVKVRFEDEDHEVSVKDLKRLFGQEKALTQKSQQVAAQRKAVEEANQKAAAQLDRLHQKAMARWEPYSKIDMLVASKQLDADTFAALRKEAQEAYDEVRFITQEVEGFVQNANAQRQQQMKETAAQSVKTLQEKIPGWDSKTYDSVRSYAVSLGMPEHVVNSVVDHFALEMMYKAMKFDQAKTVVTKKVNKTPAKVLKPTKVVTTTSNKVDKSAKAKQRLQRSGSTEDAADVFLSRWAV
ncbi:hypothetical protein AWB76_07217 [Caballeronia temeraria]|uniref:Scaffolding protein n=1 Tax=Caballeronia temeraria TaxID=1777137 RepID=A0A158DMU4_9BURK|nr:hypothetical protein [Caballeronia temeraria]SAK95914.1 hypothetical protein AWB76_07217 [Caballeronia temeraria]